MRPCACLTPWADRLIGDPLLCRPYWGMVYDAMRHGLAQLAQTAIIAATMLGMVTRSSKDASLELLHRPGQAWHAAEAAALGVFPKTSPRAATAGSTRAEPLPDDTKIVPTAQAATAHMPLALGGKGRPLSTDDEAFAGAAGQGA